MEEFGVESRVIRKVAVWRQYACVDVTFHNGHSWRYDQLPPEVIDGMMEAESKGSYYNSYIKGKFPSVKLK